MKHGFKTSAERQAENIRQEIGLSKSGPLLARETAKHLEVKIVTPQEIGVTDDVLAELQGERSSSKWSAVTIYPSGHPLIIHNSKHATARQETDLMHEIAHILCKHRPTRIIKNGILPVDLREYDVEQEEEADWLAGALKVPRDALWAWVRRDKNNGDIATYFQCSTALVQMRRNRTGVDVQRKRWAAYRPKYILPAISQ